MFYNKIKKTERLKSKIALSAAAMISAAILTVSSIMGQNISDTFSVIRGEKFEINNVFKTSESLADEKAMEVDSVLSSAKSYSSSIRLFGIIPIKSVNVDVVEKQYVVPCGTLFGLKIFTDGVLVVGMTDVATANGLVNPAENAGIKIGDVIVSMNSEKVNSSEDVAKAIENCGGEKVKAEIRRKNMSFEVEITPAKEESDGVYKMGLWVRDSSAGIGTLTFYDPETGLAAGLGHAICDVDTGEMLPIMSGEMVEAEILGITKGVSGDPGEIRGKFKSSVSLGRLIQNCETGVYGVLNEIKDMETVEIALKQDIEKGAAQIISTLDNESGAEYFDCTIEKVYYNDDSPTQNIVIKITDEELLEKTGGIIQGMSGSPIIQNGKLVGAVTHVFVNDPTKGYGIFAENMYKTAKEAETTLSSNEK